MATHPDVARGLDYVIDYIPTLKDSMFDYGNKESDSANLLVEGITIELRKSLITHADQNPEYICYVVNLGAFMPIQLRQQPMMVWVLKPQDSPAVNRAAALMGFNVLRHSDRFTVNIDALTGKVMERA